RGDADPDGRPQRRHRAVQVGETQTELRGGVVQPRQEADRYDVGASGGDGAVRAAFPRAMRQCERGPKSHRIRREPRASRPLADDPTFARAQLQESTYRDSHDAAMTQRLVVASGWNRRSLPSAEPRLAKIVPGGRG